MAVFIGRKGLALLGCTCLWIWQAGYGLVDAAPSAYTVFLTQGEEEMGRGNFVAAEDAFARAKKAAPSATEDLVRDVDARRAALYIHAGEYDRSARILKPYVESRKASGHMICDYMMALRFDNRGKEALEVFRTYCPDWQQVPSYGLQTVGDISLRAGDWRQASAVYAFINKRENLDYVHLSNAYALAMLGREGKAAAEYREVLRHNPKFADAVAGDGDAYLREGKLEMARLVYRLAGETSGEAERYALRYGEALVAATDDLQNERQNFVRDELLDGKGYFHEIQRVLKPLAKSGNLEVRTRARAALVKNAANQGWRGAAECEFSQALSEANDHPAVLSAGALLAHQTDQDLALAYTSSLDNKRNHASAWTADYRVYLGGNLYGVAGLGFTRLQDDRLHTSYRSSYAGAAYRFERGEAQMTGNAFGSGFRGGYTASLTYEGSDAMRLSFAIGRRPHDAAGTVADKICEDFHSLHLDLLPWERWRIGVDYAWSALADGNDSRAWGLDGSYRLSLRHTYRDALLFSYGHEHYREERDRYDSPDCSVDYAAGFSRKWFIPRRGRQIEWIQMLDWSRDDDDPMSFSPYSRLAWHEDLPAGQSLLLGAQYNWYFHQPGGEHRRPNGYGFDVHYEIGW